jgi:senataxin
MLVTPETKEDMGGEVKAVSQVKESELELLLKRRKSRSAYYFDLEKLSTHIREYLAVSNILRSKLAPAILAPTLFDSQAGSFVQQREVLDNILTVLKERFNETQYFSIREMVFRHHGFILLQGPPGTGKTSTLMGLLSAQYEYLRKVGDTRKIMICAPSNAAVDHIVKRISQEGLIDGEGNTVRPAILRMGIVENPDPDVRRVSLDNLCEQRLLENKETARKLNSMTTVQIKDKIVGLDKEIKHLGRREEKKEELREKTKERQLLERLLFDFRAEKSISSRKAYVQIENKLIREAEIILTTLASSGNEKTMARVRGNIACLIVDEAAQATEANLLIGLQTGVGKVLLVGDPYQLPATCLSSDANITLFNRSLFERFLDAGIRPYFLNIQYRMAPLIRHFPSVHFYQDRLLDAPLIASRSLPPDLLPFASRSVLFLDAKLGEEMKQGDSHCNPCEARVVSALIARLLRRDIQVGVITPYQAQRRAIVRECQKGLRSSEQLELFEKQVRINTVDSFQGQEKEVIIVSTVRANSRQQVGFLSDERRINVTLTRAKQLLVVVGHGDTLGSNEVFHAFLSWIEQQRLYYSITEGKYGTEQVLDNAFTDFSHQKVRRTLYATLSSDIRKTQRHKIESNDFRRPQKKRQEQEEAMVDEAEERQEGEEGGRAEEGEREEEGKEEKHALGVEQSRQIVA